MLARFRPRPALFTRTYASSNWNRPSPPPLPKQQQLEFEELHRASQTPLAKSSSSDGGDVSVHPDAPEPIKATFEGDVNPVTGEQGGPKREPVGKWGDEGDWSFKGRVSDF